MRLSKYGEFYGCSGFPKCAYTEKLKIEKSSLEKKADEFLKKNGRSDLIMY